MPAEDPGDIFLQHRGQVLEALLADPSFDRPGSGTGVRSGYTEPSFAEPDPDGPAPRRAGDGPRASERILALLNGQSHDTHAEEYPEQPVTRRPEPDPPAEEPPSSAPRPAPGGDVVDRARAQLRKPKVALAIAAVVALLLVLLLVTTGGKSGENTDNLAVVTPQPTAAPLPTSPAAPQSDKIVIKSAQAKCPPGSTSPMDAFGGEQGKAWSCVRAFKVDGQVITIDLGKTYEVDSIGIVPGWDSVSADGTDQWAKFRTVSKVSYRFDDADTRVYTQKTLDQRTLVVTKMEPPIKASRIVLTVLESKGDASVNVTAISSIVITGK